MKLTKHQLKIIPRIQRKYNVSVGFLQSNMPSIEKFLWYALSPRLVIKRIAIRKGNKQRVILNYYHLRRMLFDQAERKVIKTRRRNVQQWSRQMVCYLRKKHGVKEHIEITSLGDNLDVIDESKETPAKDGNMAPEEVTKQLKEQLELLRSGKRIVPLMESEHKSAENGVIANESTKGTLNGSLEKTLNCASSSTAVGINHCSIKDVTDSHGCSHIAPAVLNKTDESVVQSTLETTPEKQIIGRVETRLEQPKHSYKADRNMDADSETVELSPSTIAMSRPELFQSSEDKTTSKSLTSNSTFLDMLMNKVRGKNNSTEVSLDSNALQPCSGGSRTPERSCDVSHDNNEHFTDSGEEFFGFDETERLPGMMLTPLVPFSAQSKGDANVAFISESLNEFMRENLLESSSCVANSNENAAGRKHRQATLDGLVTPECVPPRIEMPLVPESLQKLRTVAERRQYLQKFNRNHKLAIINNEAAICRELQRKMRHQKSKSVSQQLLQAPNSQMPFTRQGWQAASFVTTEFNHYYYQTLDVRDGQERLHVRLPGVRGNNEERNKQCYHSRVPSKRLTRKCNRDRCNDALVWRDLRPVKTEPDKRKLNRSPLPSVFKPCPLSHKPFQKPLDDETAPLLLSGSSMAVVRMPIVELEVFPAVGKPLHEVAKRYLDYILPHFDITREWAEFSVSTLQQSAEFGKNENSANQTIDRTKLASGSVESFSFPIPYKNDRSHILVRRVVDRSEKLDETFETAASPVEDFSFRANVNESDSVLVECADVLSEMINSVAISCSENSFIKRDPDGLHAENDFEEKASEKLSAKDEQKGNSKAALDDPKIGTQAAANKKQNRLLLELRRLNATIIDAAVKAEKGAKPCAKEYCTLGCVCQSLADDYPIRQHCGKSKCVIECTCKGTNQSRIMRLETDGRSITTEDAFMLRRQATARLARMEKEFTSTIVLTENETLLINESQYDKKRRCTKVPKRYEDIADTDDDYAGRSSANTPPKKTQNAAVVAIEASTESSLNSGFSETTTELREPIYVQDKVLEKLNHCNVPLFRFEGSQNMAVWCMVHELYKCHCGGRATEGKPLVIEKDTGNNTTPCNDQASLGNKHNAHTEEEYVVKSTKKRYSFEKVEEEIEAEEEETPEERRVYKRKSTDRKSQGSVVKNISTDDEESESDEGDEMLEDSPESDFDDEIYRAKRPKMLKKRQERRGRPSEMSFINKYFNTNADGCRRVVVVPRKTYLRLNRKRRTEVQEYIVKHEKKQTMLLLNEHIMRSVYYHKHELEKQRKEAAHDSMLLNKKRKLKEADKPEVQDETKKESGKEQSELAKKKRLNDKDRKLVEQINDEDSCQSSISSLLSTSTGKPISDKRLRRRSRQHQKSMMGSNKVGQEAAAETAKSSVVEEDINLPDTSTSTKSTNIGMSDAALKKSEQETGLSDIQKSSNNHDLSLSDDTEPSASSVSAYRGVGESLTDISSVTSECSAALSLSLQPSSSLSHSRIDFFRDVVRSMNNLVNKKMQDIGLALKRESKVIPAPNNEILCIIKWSNFLDAFVEGFVFIWQVKLRDDQNFFAATISNMMPMVLDAVGVVNIAALPMQQLPLLGSMLLQRCRSPQTRDLAIVMQGRSKYWLVKGFLRADKSSACAKPTPKSHPLLTRKINVLSSLLAKQHIRELNKKILQSPNEQLPDTSEVEKSSATLPIENTSSVQNSLFKEQLPPPAYRESKISENNSNNNNKNAGDMQNKKQGTIGKKTRLQNQLEPPIVRCPLPSSTICNSTLSAMDKSKAPNSLSVLQELIGNSQYSEMKTNVSFRKVTSADFGDMHGLDLTLEPHRWLVLDLYKDFSHIYVPDFQELVSLDRILKVMAFSRQKQKIVKLQFFQNAAYDAFVTPSSQRKIYFGPLKLNTPPPLLVLLQSVDRKMMLRESYQQMHSIQEDSSESTTAFWVVRKSGQMHLDLELTDSIEEASEVEEESFGELQPTKTIQHAESDDDCMIVDDAELLVPFSPLVPLTQPNITVKPLAKLQTPPNDTTLQRQLTNFTIQTSAKSNRLQITNLGTTAETSNSQFQKLPNTTDAELVTGQQQPVIPMEMPLNTQLVPSSTASSNHKVVPSLDKQPPSILCGLPPNAVITGVAPAPQEAPYGSTIFISSLPSMTPTGAGCAQLVDKQVAADAQLNSHIPPASALGNTIANNNNTASINAFGATSKVRFLTPDVRVTATVDSVVAGGTFSAPALTTVTNTNPTMFSSPSTEQQYKTGCLSSQAAAEPVQTVNTVTTTSPSNKAQQPASTDTTNSAKNSAVNWRRFLLDDSSKSSMIGSTTITKMPEKLQCPITSALNGELEEIPMNIEEDEFEPAASIVFKPQTVLTALEASNARPLATKVVSAGNNSNSYQTKATTNATTTTATPTTITTAALPNNTKATPMTLLQPVTIAHATYSLSKPATGASKAQVMNLPIRTMAPLKERHILPKQAVAKSTSFQQRMLAKKTTSSVTTTKPTIAILQSPKIPTSKTSTLQQSFIQQLKMPPQPLRPSTVQSIGTRPSLPLSSRASASTTTTTNSPVTNTSGVYTPKPLINVWSAVPLPQRTNTAIPTTQRRRDPVLLGTGVSNARLGGNMPASKGPTQCTIPQRVTSTSASSLATHPVAAGLSKPKGKLNIYTSVKSFNAATKMDEQYGMFCSGSTDGSPRFWAKRVQNSYIIKVPGLSSVVQRSDLESVGTYLNQHLMRQSQNPAMKAKLPLKWKFVPSDQLNLPIKMLTTNKDGSTTEQVLVRRFKVPEFGESAAKVGTSSPVCKFLKDVAIAPDSASDTKGNEPILIED